MSAVSEVFNMSSDFLDELSKSRPKSERDSLILKITEFLEKREILLKELKGPFTPEEQQLGKQLIENEQKFQAILQSIKEEIQQDFLAAKNIKKNTPKYINPYTNVFNEGAYLDKKN